MTTYLHTRKKEARQLLESLPWAKVFPFLCGKDVARAIMASKDNSPWKTTACSPKNVGNTTTGNDNHQQQILPALKIHLESTETGRYLLRLCSSSTGNNELSTSNNPQNNLPMLLDRHERGHFFRFDGLYCRQAQLTTGSNAFYRFFPDGTCVYYEGRHTISASIYIFMWSCMHTMKQNGFYVQNYYMVKEPSTSTGRSPVDTRTLTNTTSSTTTGTTIKVKILTDSLGEGSKIGHFRIRDQVLSLARTEFPNLTEEFRFIQPAQHY